MIFILMRIKIFAMLLKANYIDGGAFPSAESGRTYLQCKYLYLMRMAMASSFR